MKLDVNSLRYLSKDDFRVLTAVEMGMRNHELVPAELVDRIAGLRHGGTYKVLKNLLKHKLVHHDSSKYDGFRLTYLGYDFLAIKTLVNRGVFNAVGRQIGVGKESDIFEVATEDGTILVMKLHRLGRMSFRAVKSKRDYLKHRSSYNWLYLSRLAALKEFAFMKALGEHEFPVPDAIDCNRHCVVMSLVQGYPLVQVQQLQNTDEVLETIVGLVVRLAEHGLIHCDFNEFNIMIDDNEKVTMIDFPQMVSVSHRNAKMYFDRDIECIFKFFAKRFKLVYEDDECDGAEADEEENGRPSFSSIAKSVGFLDRELSASGFTRKDQDDIEKFIEGGTEQTDITSSEDELEEQVQAETETDASIVQNIDLLKLEDQNNEKKSKDDTSCNENGENDDGILQPGQNSEKDSDNESDDGDDDELTKRLYRQRRRAIAAAQGTRRAGSRNAYKDKGGKSGHNSKVQRQFCKW
ncbi:serine/threonine-protein kinase rio2-like [Zingiber officinale]|uniref:serine/threonine-protein kinase rio2-like n=1 Tax=Zingiber officinale TaxID=94328 RepID=UPI001C4AB885|nr:serine/threonine-protein kinase rio2-like [Zingiber officinale]